MSIHSLTAQFDLGMTPIENLFLEEFMPYADGDDIKVYLLGLKLLQENKQPTISLLAQRLSLEESEIIKSYEYWASQGIIKLTPATPEPMVYYLSLRSVYLESNFTRKTLPTSLEATPYFSEVFREVDSTLAVALSEPERQQLMPFLQSHPVKPEIVAMAFDDARRSKQRTKKALEHLRYWVEHGVTELDDVLVLKDRLNLRQLQYKQVLSALGNPYDQPTAGDRESIDRWLDEYQFSLEKIVEKVTEVTLRKRKPSMAYLNAVFKNEFEGNTSSSEPDDDLDALFRKRR